MAQDLTTTGYTIAPWLSVRQSGEAVEFYKVGIWGESRYTVSMREAA